MAKNIDYSNSAERLTNPESVRLLLLARLGLNSAKAELEKELEMRSADLLIKIKGLTEDLADNESEIRDTVQADGGYQDIDAGLYALRQRRVTYTYDPALFKKWHPDLAPAVIKEIVDTAKIAGLIKGGLLNMASLERDEVVKASETFAFIIKAEAIQEGK